MAMIEQSDKAPLEAPLGELERSLIDEYLRAVGYDPLTLDQLPEPLRNNLLREASVYASGKLMEVESRSHFLQEIHRTPLVTKAGFD
jgi:hypothetical protein